jgi:PAS domain S-box-containing protein
MAAGDETTERAERVRRRASGLRERSRAGAAPGELLDEALETLQDQFEALAQTDEELRVQNEELAATQEALAAEHQRYRELFEQAPDPYLVTDAAGALLDANAAAVAVLGMPRGRLAGRSLAAFLPVGERRAFRARLAGLPRTGREEGWPLRLRPSGGEPRELVATAALARDDAGQAAVRWLMRDVTDRVRAEESTRMLADTRAALADAEAARQRLVAVLEETTDAFFSVDGDWRFTYVNRRGEEYWQSPREQMLGRRLWDLFPAMVNSEAFHHLQRAMHERRPVDYEAISRVTGRWVEGHAYPRADGLAVFFRDVSRRKRLEETRRYLDELSSALAVSLDYDATLQSIARLATGALADCCMVHVLEGGRVRSPGIAHVDPDREGEVRALMRAIPADLEAGTPVARVLRGGEPLLFPHVSDAALAAAAGGPEQLDALRALKIATGMVVPLHARGRTLGAISFARLGGPRPAYTEEDLELAVELARRAALAADNARLYARATAAVRARDDVLAIVSHDLRNPVNAILISATMLHEFAPPEALGPRDMKQVEVIRRSAEQMSALLQDLVEVALLEGGAPTMNRARCEVATLLAAVTDMFGPLARDKGLELHCPPAEGLPPVDADYGRVLQVLSNLLGNAIKFTPPGGSIRVAADAAPGAVRFAVYDSGVGIEPEHLPHVFDRFWQARSTRRAGAGLGLAIARSIVTAHGGRIWVESTPGGGSTFAFTLPVHPDAAAGGA